MKVTIILILFFNLLTFAEEWIYFNKNNTPLISSGVVAVAETRPNEYYLSVTEPYGFYKYIPPSGWTRLDVAGSIFEGEQIFELYKDNFNRLWALGSKIFFLNEGTWNKIDTNLDICCIAVEEMNLIWFGTYYHGLYKYDLDTFTKIESDQLAYEINTIVIDDKKNKWIGMDDSGELVKMNGDTIEKISHPEFLNYWDIPVAYSVNSLAFDKEGFLWITANVIVPPEYTQGHQTYNYAKYHPVTKEWVLYGINDVGEGTWPMKRSLVVDKINNKWDATNDGLMLYDNNSFQFLNPQNSGLKFSKVYDIFIDYYGNKWIMGNSIYGVAIFNMIEIKNITDVEKDIYPTLSYELKQNYPNPFNATTKIKYTVPSFATAGTYIIVTLKVHDILGNEVVTLVNEQKTEGEYETEFDAGNLPSNIYFYTLTVGENRVTKKMVLLK